MSLTCATINCEKAAQLQCPTCLKNGVEEGSYFCSQDCFKSSWSTHKSSHKKTQTTLIDPFPGYRYTGSLRPVYPLSIKRAVPAHIPRPDYAIEENDGKPLSELSLRGSNGIKILNDEEIEGMRVVGKLSRQVLDAAAAAISVGMTTDELDRIVHETCIDLECYPSPLCYYNFPKSCCTSVNEVVCHGIPDMRPLLPTDICNVDISVMHRGFHGDLNETFLLSDQVSEVATRLVKNTWECLQKAIEEVKPGTKYRDIGTIIQKHAQSQGFSVVRSYCGHGIHRLFHTAPSIPHYAKNKAIGVMKPGHCFTIEPMINEGSWRDTTWPDDWTAVTADGKLSAQFEETLLVTETGVEIISGRANSKPYFMDK